MITKAELFKSTASQKKYAHLRVWLIQNNEEHIETREQRVR